MGACRMNPRQLCPEYGGCSGACERLFDSSRTVDAQAARLEHDRKLRERFALDTDAGERRTRHEPEPYEAARDTLTTALDYIAGPRSSDYGHPLDNHTRTAVLLNAYLRAKALTVSDELLVELIRTGEWLDPDDVCWLNVEQKVARDMNRPTFDGPVDVAGYAGNVAELRAERDRRS